MMGLQAQNRFAVLALIFLSFVRDAISISPNVVSTNVVQNKDITPVIGRGFSFSSDGLFGNCLEFGKISHPTMDYSYIVFDYMNSSTKQVDLSSLEDFSGYHFVREAFNNVMRESTEEEMIYIYFAVGALSIDKYYIAGSDSDAYIVDDAADFLSRRDYVSFIQTCGTSYIRSVRRKSEFIGTFTYNQSGEDFSEKFLVAVQRDLRGVKNGQPSTAFSASRSLRIMLKGFGMGYSLEMGGITASDISEFTTLQNMVYYKLLSPDQGTVRSIEVIPWGSNLDFLELANFNPNSDATSVTATSVTAYQMKVVLHANAEHIITISLLLEERLAFLADLFACTYELNSKPEAQQHNVVRNLSGLPTNVTMTVHKLKQKLTNEVRGQSLIQRETERMTRWMQEYFSPCINRFATPHLDYEGGRLFTTMWSDVVDLGPNEPPMDECTAFQCITPMAIVYETNPLQCAYSTETNEAVAHVQAYCPLELEKNLSFIYSSDGSIESEKEYYINKQFMSWEQHRNKAQMWSGDMTSIVSANENEQLRFHIGNLDKVFVGAISGDNENDWTWSDEEAWRSSLATDNFANLDYTDMPWTVNTTHVALNNDGAWSRQYGWMMMPAVYKRDPIPPRDVRRRLEGEEEVSDSLEEASNSDQDQNLLPEEASNAEEEPQNLA